jgi:hypothetical protein
MRTEESTDTIQFAIEVRRENASRNYENNESKKENSQ